MKYILPLSGLFLALFAFMGCETTRGSVAAENYNAEPLTVVVPKGISSTQVQNIMGQTLSAREWSVTESSADKVVGILNHRDFRAKVTLERSGDIISILSEATKWNYKTDSYEPAVPIGWLENIQKDLRKRLSTASYDSFK